VQPALVLLLLSVPLPPRVEITVFESSGCQECVRTEAEVVSPLQRELGPAIRIHRRSIEDPNTYEALLRLERRFGVRPEERALPVVHVGDRLLVGRRAIARELPLLVRSEGSTTASVAVDASAACEDPSCLPGPPIWIAYVYQPGCRACSRVEADLRYVRMRHPRVMVEPLSSYERLPLARWLAERAGRELATPAVFVGDGALIGDREISVENLELLLAEHDGGAAPFWRDAPEAVLDREARARFRAVGPAAIVLAGLLDGVNPCAFATLIFLVSYLAATGRRGRQVLSVGAAFTCGVFLAYLAVGLGMHRAIAALGAWMIEVERWLLILTGAACVVLAAFSLGDWWKARRGRIEEMSLVLPEPLKQRIRAVVRKSARTRTYVAASFGAGVVVSLLELACTGQVYLPTIVFMTSIPELEERAMGYLVLYNLMFTVPLIAVFVVVYFGTTSKRLTELFHRHAAAVKLGFAVLFSAMAIWLLSAALTV
jgi:cytochrome c biogenesis protein CcdA